MIRLKIWFFVGKLLGVTTAYNFIDIYSEDGEFTDAILFAKNEVMAHRFIDSWDEE